MQMLCEQAEETLGNEALGNVFTMSETTFGRQHARRNP